MFFQRFGGCGLDICRFNGLVILKKNPDRSAVGIIILTIAYGPEKGCQKASGKHHTESYKDKDDTHIIPPGSKIKIKVSNFQNTTNEI
jgi:hypothetical protein